MVPKRYQHWTREEDGNGILWLHLDVVGSDVNVLSSAVIGELEGILTELEASPPKGVVFLSGKASGFIAGADVNEFRSIKDRADALAIINRGQGLMNRIDALPCPTVAAINGFCMGGGLELALACDYRVGLDDPKTRLGLPEVKLGIHPGYGGTVRAVQVLGPVTAMDLMLTGRSTDARRARKIGLLDYVTPKRHFRNAARSLIETRPEPHRPGRFSRLLNHRVLRPLIAQRMRKQVVAKVMRAHYPAPYALIDLWQHGAGNERSILEKEAESVATLSTTDTARNLVRVFLLQNQLKAQADKQAINVQHVHVIGAGVMGGDIAAWCTLQGLKVTVQDTDTKCLAGMLERASNLLTRRLKAQRLVTGAMDRLIPDNRGVGVRQADVIIEAIFEDIEAKQALYRNVEPTTKPEAVIATNTSSIPIETLCRALNDPTRLVGLHFFNPVAQLPLVEIVYGTQTRDDVIAKALGFTRHIDKLPLKVKSTPGFLVNRILMPYLLEAIIMEAEGVPKCIIDQAAKDFGMPMGPIELADAVGLDVGLHVGQILGNAYGFQIPDKLRDMVGKGHLGKKSGKGFYEYRNGKSIKEKGQKYGGDIRELQDRLILRLVNEAVACLREKVVDNADLIDAGVIFGTGFAPFRGGPLHYRESKGREMLRARLQQLQNQFGDRFAPDEAW